MANNAALAPETAQVMVTTARWRHRHHVKSASNAFSFNLWRRARSTLFRHCTQASLARAAPGVEQISAPGIRRIRKRAVRPGVSLWPNDPRQMKPRVLPQAREAKSAIRTVNRVRSLRLWLGRGMFCDMPSSQRRNVPLIVLYGREKS